MDLLCDNCVIHIRYSQILRYSGWIGSISRLVLFEMGVGEYKPRLSAAGFGIVEEV